MKVYAHSSIVLLLLLVNTAICRNVFEFAMKNAKDQLPKEQILTGLKETLQHTENGGLEQELWTKIKDSGRTASRSGPKVTSFSWKDCDTTSALVNIKSLSVQPFPLSFPGALKVATEFIIKKTLTDSLKTAVLMEKKIAGRYIKVPCIDEFGSCTYPDLCQLLAPIGSQCPQPIKDIGINCVCPLNAGSYKLKQTEFDIAASLIPSGDYHVIGNVTYSQIPVGCLELYLSVV